MVGLLGAATECVLTYAEYVEASSADDGRGWAHMPVCADGGACLITFPCVDDGRPGLLFNVFRDGQLVGTVCIPDAAQEATMAALVLEEFKKLQWPKSVVSVQPRGETLVNLETIFYTDNNKPSSVTVRLLSKKVTIEAKPVSYTWSFGDGTTLTTDTAGRPHPSRDVTHVYTAPEPVSVSVATTYQGTYTVEGKAPRDIPETLTVAGVEASLEVLEAKPQLVLR